MSKEITQDRVIELVNMARSCNYEELGIFLAAYATDMQRETVIDMCNDDEEIARDMYESADQLATGGRVIIGSKLFDGGIECFRDVDLDETMREQFDKHFIAQYFNVILETKSIVAR